MSLPTDPAVFCDCPKRLAAIFRAAELSRVTLLTLEYHVSEAATTKIYRLSNGVSIYSNVDEFTA
jgi:hypothetical protein